MVKRGSWYSPKYFCEKREEKEICFQPIERKLWAERNESRKWRRLSTWLSHPQFCNKRRKKEEKEIFIFCCVEEEPKRRLCPEAQSLSLIAFQHTHTRHDFFWAIGGWVSFALEATSLLEKKKKKEKVVFIPVFFFLIILIEPSFFDSGFV